MQSTILERFVSLAFVRQQFLRREASLRWRHWNAWRRKWNHVARTYFGAQSSWSSFLGFKHSRDAASLAFHWNYFDEKGKFVVGACLTVFWWISTRKMIDWARNFTNDFFDSRWDLKILCFWTWKLATYSSKMSLECKRNKHMRSAGSWDNTSRWHRNLARGNK